MYKKLTIAATLLLLIACGDNKQPPSATPQAHAEKYTLDTHYQKIKHNKITQENTRTVVEFFWYGCPHCEHFEPYLKKWKSTKPSDVQLKQVPAIWSEAMVLHAKLFFIALTMDNFDIIHDRLFKEVIAIRGEKDIEIQKAHFARVFSEFGMQEDEFSKQLSSTNILSKIDNAKHLMKLSGLTGTPAIMIDQKYLILNRSVESPDGILNIADFLIEKERNTH